MLTKYNHSYFKKDPFTMFSAAENIIYGKVIAPLSQLILVEIKNDYFINYDLFEKLYENEEKYNLDEEWFNETKENGIFWDFFK